MEPIQGEAGVIVPPEGFMKKAYELCKSKNVLFIADEVQTGFARTGTMFACEQEGFEPDVYIFGKALGGGIMPISAVVANEDIMGVFTPGSHGSTFGGNPLACAAALTTIDVVTEEGLMDNAVRIGDAIRAGFKKALEGVAGVTEIRGRGLMIGIELDRPCGELVTRALDAGLLINVTSDNVARMLPALIFSDSDAKTLVEGLAPLIREFLSQ
jgi:acetylornithine aminotransferase